MLQFEVLICKRCSIDAVTCTEKDGVQTTALIFMAQTDPLTLTSVLGSILCETGVRAVVFW